MEPEDFEGWRIGPRAQTGSRVGAYFWLPRPGPVAPDWEVVTCHDLGLDAEGGHVALWPRAIDRLAAAWGARATVLQRRLGNHYAGLPRGRVARPKRTDLALHGADAPVPDWQERIARQFKIPGRPVRFVSDPHERTLRDDRWRVADALGLDPGEVRPVNTRSR